MTANGSTRSLRQHVQRSLGDDFVEPPASVMSTMPNDDDDDDDGTEEFQPKAAARGRTTTTPGQARARGAGRQSRTGRKTSATMNPADEDSMETGSVSMTPRNNTTSGGAGQHTEEKGYFHHLLAGKTNIQVLVDQWIDSYQANRDEALIELMQFFLDSSGCKGKLTQTMYLKMEHVDMLRAMTEHFDEVSRIELMVSVVLRLAQGFVGISHHHVGSAVQEVSLIVQRVCRSADQASVLLDYLRSVHDRQSGHAPHGALGFTRPSLSSHGHVGR